MNRPLTDKSWLVTGGCGFIGRNLIRRLRADHPGVNLRILDNLSVGSREDLAEVCAFKEISGDTGRAPAGVELLVGDVTAYQDCLNAAAGVDTIVHLAANTGVAPSMEDPRRDLESNVLGTFNMLEAARTKGCRKFIFASSGAPLGEVEPPINEEKVAKPISPYGASKLAGEAYCCVYAKSFGLSTVALRFGNVYGPGSKNKNSVVAKFFKNAFAGKPLEVFGDGKQTRDFIFIEDLIEAVMLSAKADIGGEVFQIATYRETTVNEIAEMIKSIIESKMQKSVSVIHAKSRPGDMRRNYSDISKARRLLGFEPAYDISRGLLKTFEDFEARWRERARL